MDTIREDPETDENPRENRKVNFATGHEQGITNNRKKSFDLPSTSSKPLRHSLISKKPSPNVPCVPTGNKPDWYEELADDQINMFKEVFELLDRDGGGSISAKELFTALKDLDINISLEEIQNTLRELDKDGNGEIDFDEFLFAMCETDKYLDSLGNSTENDQTDRNSTNNYSKRQTLFFTAITRFALKNSLGEIGRYYAAKARHVPHVISFYTAGVRLIGLNDRQLEQQLRRMQKATKGLDSPYAKPLPFVSVSPRVKNHRKSTAIKSPIQRKEITSKETPTGENNKENVLESQACLPAEMVQRDRRRSALFPGSQECDLIHNFENMLQELVDRGSVIARLPDIHLVPQIRTKLESGDVSDPICSSLRKRRKTTQPNASEAVINGNNQVKQHHKSNGPTNSQQQHHTDKRQHQRIQYGWAIPRIDRGKAPLPVIQIKRGERRPTIEDVPKIRTKVSKALGVYYSSLKKAHMQTAWAHWDRLHTDDITSPNLLKRFRRVYRAYSPHKEEEVFAICPWIPSAFIAPSTSGRRSVQEQPAGPCSPASHKNVRMGALTGSTTAFKTARCKSASN